MFLIHGTYWVICFWLAHTGIFSRIIFATHYLEITNIINKEREFISVSREHCEGQMSLFAVASQSSIAK